MPRRRFTRKRHTKRTFHKKGRKRIAKGLQVPRSVGILKGIGMPRRLKMKMLYIDQASDWVATPGAGNAYFNNSYSVNNLYDIDTAVGAGGSLPSQFTPLSIVYGAWRVHGVKYHIEMTHTLPAPVEVGLFFTFNPGELTNATVWQSSEQPFSTKAMCLQAGSGGERRVFKGYANIGAVFGNNKQYSLDPATQGTNTGSAATTTVPTKLCTMWQWWRTLSGGAFSASSAVVYSVSRFTLYVEWFNPNIVTN